MCVWGGFDVGSHLRLLCSIIGILTSFLKLLQDMIYIFLFYHNISAPVAFGLCAIDASENPW